MCTGGYRKSNCISCLPENMLPSPTKQVDCWWSFPRLNPVMTCRCNSSWVFWSWHPAWILHSSQIVTARLDQVTLLDGVLYRNERPKSVFFPVRYSWKVHTNDPWKSPWCPWSYRIWQDYWPCANTVLLAKDVFRCWGENQNMWEMYPP